MLLLISLIIEGATAFLGVYDVFCMNGELYKIRKDVWKKYNYKSVRYIFPPQSKKYETTMPLIVNYIVGAISIILTITVYFIRTADKAVIIIAFSYFGFALFNMLVSNIITKIRIGQLPDMHESDNLEANNRASVNDI